MMVIIELSCGGEKTNTEVAENRISLIQTNKYAYLPSTVRSQIH